MLKAGSSVDYTVYYLEMRHDPSLINEINDAQVVRAKNPSVWYFISLYDAVGRDYDWVDIYDTDIQSFIQDPKVELYSLIKNGWPHGFFILDARIFNRCDISYFGLVPEAVGCGLGRWFLDQAIKLAWQKEDIKCVTVNTCTLDHPRALSLYQAAGFVIKRIEKKNRILKYDYYGL